ncbi:MAG: ATP-binding cassette domain-containing protein [Candidatus Heimdallarchaeota archaeon]|nr:ATP-binding cassette domain-containing protein [Candidatus Heimdallarchaeota archaeon]MBY8994630.1 ATP-binding cassette domain-containing protein [Candidatus Heimdallarchaeota archaeon]
MIECKDIIKIYLDEEINLRVPALRGCDLSVNEGEILSIFGPSGSGKTTLINILAGLDVCSSGEVKVGDYNLSNMSLKELNSYRLEMIGIIDQFPERTLFLDGNLNDNLKFASNVKRNSRTESKVNDQYLLERLGITHLKNRVVRGFSGGELIRAAIACALIKEAPLLLCDEPTGQLDSINTLKVKTLLKEIATEFGTTIIVVTHDPRFQDGVDKTCEIKNGRVSSILDVTDQLAYGHKKQFPLRFKLQIDSTNSIRLPDYIMNILNLSRNAEVSVTKKGEVVITHPNGLSPKIPKLDRFKVIRNGITIDNLPSTYFDKSEIIIKLDNLSKIYYDNKNVVNALSNINLQIKKGELVFILGPSGSGKTTLVKLLSGLDDETSGTIRILNNIFSNFSNTQKSLFRKQKIGLVPQQGILHPYLTITESFFLKDFFSGKVIKDIDCPNVNEYLGRFNIIHKKDSYPLEISGGELQRASLAISSSHLPQIMIIDEPTANLDSELAEEVIHEIYDLHSKTKITFLIATHDINLIRDGYRAIVLEDGKIKSDGLVIAPKHN